MKPTINVVKHIVQRSIQTIEELTVGSHLLVNVVDAQPTNPANVVVGAKIDAVFLEYWLMGETSQPVSTTWILEKVGNDAASVTYAQMQNLHDYPNKKNILRMGQGLIGDSNSNPIPILREWIKIPKGKSRFGLGDELRLSISCVGGTDEGLEFCGACIYKEQQ